MPDSAGKRCDNTNNPTVGLREGKREKVFRVRREHGLRMI